MSFANSPSCNCCGGGTTPVPFGCGTCTFPDNVARLACSIQVVKCSVTGNYNYSYYNLTLIQTAPRSQTYTAVFLSPDDLCTRGPVASIGLVPAGTITATFLCNDAAGIGDAGSSSFTLLSRKPDGTANGGFKVRNTWTSCAPIHWNFTYLSGTNVDYLVDIVAAPGP